MLFEHADSCKTRIFDIIIISLPAYVRVMHMHVRSILSDDKSFMIVFQCVMLELIYVYK